KTPVNLRILQGNRGHEAKAALNKGPDWSGKFGSCPKWLTGEGRRLWRKLAPALEEKGLSASVYAPILGGLCSHYARWREAETILDEKGLTMTVGEGGYTQQRPEVSVAQKSWSLFAAACARFGLSPADVSKVQGQTVKQRALSEIAAERAAAVRAATRKA
ncbi:MAG: phage terminase small subunit P27 family, partial [Acidobacteria bacterium]|nr:phage terminase small subunit P27 family [Acidobacteriota bacterium]